MSEIKRTINTDTLYFPINIVGEEKLIEIFLLDQNVRKKIFEFRIPVLQTETQQAYPFDYYARFPVKQFTDKTIILKGEVPEVFFHAVCDEQNGNDAPPERPSIHFTAQHSWINDPNGLHYKDGMYHLYYQYNPFHIKWNNMSWGHATSHDLLHWTEQDAVLFPDEHGMIFSGCGIINEKGYLGLPCDASVFFYTAAGGITPWSENKPSTQRIAYSLDEGYTLTKMESGVTESIEQENRDPKVFWHENSNSYIMCLWLKENEFAVLRSENLEKFTVSHRFSLDQAWECPDLFCLKDKNGKEHWVFWSADGYYYFGSFDGYHFVWDGIRHHAYMNQIPYAAQTVSGVCDRVITIPWLRLEFYQKEVQPKACRYYTGAMGIPREITLVEDNGGYKLALNYVRELFNYTERIELPCCSKQEVRSERCCLNIADQNETTLLIERMTERNDAGYDFTIDLYGNLIQYNSDHGMIQMNEQQIYVGEKIKDFSFLLDDVIFEVTANHGIITGAFQLTRKHNSILIDWNDTKRWKLFSIHQNNKSII